MPNYRRPRRSRHESDPNPKHIPGSDEENEHRGPQWSGDLDDSDDTGDFDEDGFALSSARREPLDEDALERRLFDAAFEGEDDEEDAARRLGLSHIPAELGDEFEIIDLANELDADDDLDDPDAEDLNGAAYRDHLPVDALLHELASAQEFPPLARLYSFSDLTQHDVETVRRGWELIQPERRRALVDRLVTVAEEDLDFHIGSFLRIAMADEDAAVRSTAVRGLWEDGQADLVGPLVQMLHNDPDVETRAAAATALGSYVLAGELEEVDVALAMRAEEALLAILHDETEPVAVRRRALESIAYSGEAGVRQLIEDAYYSPHDEMRISALFAMGRSADVRWRSLARAELQNPSPAVRAEAALACGELEAKSALEDLLALLQDRKQTVRLAAIFALGRIGGQDARDALDTVILAGIPDEVEAAEQALEEMQFYAENDAIALYDESMDDEDEWDNDPGDGWLDWEDRDLGTYE